jgi:hypothetical protein
MLTWHGVRNIIERFLGVNRRRWKVFRTAIELRGPDAQSKLIYAAFCLHAFIRRESAEADAGLEAEAEQQVVAALGSYSGSPMEDVLDEDDVDARNWRDTIAQRMWFDYQRERYRRDHDVE